MGQKNIWVFALQHLFLFHTLVTYPHPHSQTRFFLCSPGFSGTCYIYQIGLGGQGPPVSASQVLVLKAMPPEPGNTLFFF